jgi:hypothetical protein
MRLLLLALTLALGTTVSAQGALPAPAPRAPTVEDGLLLALVGTGTSVAALTVARSASQPLASAVAGVAVLGTSSALGLRPSVPGVALDAAVGAGAGLLAREVYLGVYDNAWVDVEALMVGLAAGAVATGASHVVRLSVLRSDGPVQLAPAALAAPTGERAAGLHLRIGL